MTEGRKERRRRRKEQRRSRWSDGRKASATFIARPNQTLILCGSSSVGRSLGRSVGRTSNSSSRRPTFSASAGLPTSPPSQPWPPQPPPPPPTPPPFIGRRCLLPNQPRAKVGRLVCEMASEELNRGDRPTFEQSFPPSFFLPLDRPRPRQFRLLTAGHRAREQHELRQ